MMICVCRHVPVSNEMEKVVFDLLLSLVHESIGNDEYDQILFGINEIMFKIIFFLFA
jgi:hypothetical protein